MKKGRGMKIPLPPAVQPTNEMLTLIAAIDEFKGEWRALGSLGPESRGAWHPAAWKRMWPSFCRCPRRWWDCVARIERRGRCAS